MTTNKEQSNELPWSPEEEHTIWMQLVIVAPDRKAAYDKANKWVGNLGETGSRPEDCIQYGIDMVEREEFPKAHKHIQPHIEKQECKTCNGTGNSVFGGAGMPCLTCMGIGYI